MYTALMHRPLPRVACPLLVLRHPRRWLPQYAKRITACPLLLTSLGCPAPTNETLARRKAP